MINNYINFCKGTKKNLNKKAADAAFFISLNCDLFDYYDSNDFFSLKEYHTASHKSQKSQFRRLYF
jgi:hypothetical protein